ncbi:Nmd4p Ecym_6268 [Eremothecium cymbalariae DBVPG|uniref:PIN domain-containing protein n=1 Tax=Eremothecium cymbalariae (strain CBS 270.75 / DBVPG 7215 / KCTC 17166 / NRRL Y-17582) TaxID=931890 RepID=G8JVH0_ERECY|nr:hypothetical protein Ecym_6268 [Eremothecium cymbalariae DBVPG\
MSVYFILDASVFQKGLGNIRQWYDDVSSQKQNLLQVHLYIPTYTLMELDFQQAKRKSYIAGQSLKFIDGIKESQWFHLHLEYPETVGKVLDDDVARFAKGSAGKLSISGLRPKFQTLLKSCVYKCLLEEEQKDANWIVVTEDPHVVSILDEHGVPHVDLMQADRMVQEILQTIPFKRHARFNEDLRRTVRRVELDGKQVFKTSFEQVLYAPRGRGTLWSP